MLDFFAPRVAAMRRARNVAGLVDALRTGGLRTRRAAANALIEIADPRAIDVLIAALKDDDELVRINAALALGEFQGRPELANIVGPLSEALNDPSPRVRAMAASALARAKDPSAVPALIRALDDENENVRATAAAVLPTFEDERASEALAAKRVGAS